MADVELASQMIERKPRGGREGRDPRPARGERNTEDLRGKRSQGGKRKSKEFMDPWKRVGRRTQRGRGDPGQTGIIKKKVF